MAITDNATTNETIKNGIGSTVRAALVFVGALLVRKGFISQSQTDAYIPDVTAFLTGIVLNLGALLWAWWQKHKKNVDVDKAIAVPPSTTRADFEAIKAEVKQS
jgi:hypothetical protein